MANTVNDVMNVIASPDYGIKNIAVTNKEILAILQGNTNSQNNIHNLVDDVKTLLQKLVTVATEKKPTPIGNAVTKINNHKNIQDILDETKGIRKSIDNLAKSIIKQNIKGSNPAVAKLSDKASAKVAEAMVKNLEKQNKGGGMSAFIDIFTKLKDVSLKDIIFGELKVNKISKIFNTAKESLNIKEKELNNIVKIINASPEIIKSLNKVGWRLYFTIKNNVIKKLSDILIGENSLLTLSQVLQKNEKVFDKANKATKSIKELTTSLNKIVKNLSFVTLWVKPTSKGIDSIVIVLNKIIDLSKILAENKKHIDTSTKIAKQTTILVGNLLVSSILLTVAAVTGGPAILGAKLISKMVENIIPTVEKLAKSEKHIKKATNASIMFIAFTGLMAVSSLFLASIAVTGTPALLGSILITGIVSLNIYTFKLLSKSKSTIIKGAISMLIMTSSLILFGVALNKITQATKGVDFKQVGVIASLTILLGGTVALLGIPAVVPFIILGSLSMGVMGLALIPFANTLGKIAKATKHLKMKHIGIISASMLSFATSIAGLAFLSIPVAIGSVTLLSMTNVLHKFAKTLKIINKLDDNITKSVHQVLNLLGVVGDFFSKKTISVKGIWEAMKYKAIMRPFSKTLKYFVKLKELGSIPMKLVHQTLNAMSTIANYYKENPISIGDIWEARQYKRMMRPFGKTLKYFVKLKELGSIPMKLVHQTLNAMSTIANYYKENPISIFDIWEARQYKRMMRPFGKTLKYFIKLKELGSLPMKLVHQTLNAMSTIANYYKENPISAECILEAITYKAMLRPFGKTLKYFVKLKELGSIPMKLVHQTLNAMTAIANYYIENPIELKTIRQARRYKRMMKPFGKTINHLSKLKEMGSIPMKLVYQTLNAMSIISDFYTKQDVGFFDGIKTRISAKMINGFISSFGDSVEHLKALKDIQSVPSKAVESVVVAIGHIMMFYKTSSFKNIKYKNEITKKVVDDFSQLVKTIKVNLQSFSENDVTNVIFAISSTEQIIKFLKEKTLNVKEIIKARNNINILKYFTSTISKLSNINQSNMSSVGEALTNTLNGVNTVDLGQVQAVTNMFNAFNGINKSEGIINKFTESVKEFTTTCKNLMDAMNYNTDAINNFDVSVPNDSTDSTSIFDRIRNNIANISTNNNNTNENNGVCITNVDEIAKSIAEKINGALSVDIPDAQVQLFINGMGGNEWTISRY